MIDTKTEYLNLPLPNEQNELVEDCPRIVRSFRSLDAYAKQNDLELDAALLAVGNAQETADQAVTNAATAQRAAENAQSAANEAQRIANSAKSEVESAMGMITEMANKPQFVVVGKPIATLGEYASNLAENTFIVESTPLLQSNSVSHFLMTIPELDINKKRFDADNNASQIRFIVPESISTGSLINLEIVSVDICGNQSQPLTAKLSVINEHSYPAQISWPLMDATDIYRIPVIMLEPFKPFLNSSDVAAKTQIQIANDSGFTNMVWDSGEVPAVQSIACGISLESEREYYCRARWRSLRNGIGKWSKTIRFRTGTHAVRAVAQDMTGVAGRELKRIDIDGYQLPEQPDFMTHPIYSRISEKLIDNQFMIGFPKCFFKRGALASGADAWFVSDITLPGYDIHPAFLAKDGTTALEQIWIGKYQAGSDGSRASSMSGVSPLTNINFTTMQDRCKARNIGGVAGFHLWNIHELSLINLLMMIEYAGTDFQMLIGRGHVDNNPSGVQVVNHVNVAQASWRGLVGLWGNIWQMCDGLRAGTNGKWKIDMGKGFIDTGISMPNTNFCPDKILKGKGSNWSVNHLFLGDPAFSASGEKYATFPDLQCQSYNTSTEYIYYVGGYYNGSSAAGPFSLNNNTPSNSNNNIGVRLAKW